MTPALLLLFFGPASAGAQTFTPTPAIASWAVPAATLSGSGASTIAASPAVASWAVPDPIFDGGAATALFGVSALPHTLKIESLASPFLLHVVEGWTAEIGPFTLRDQNGPFSLDGFTVALVLKGLGGASLAATVRKDADQVARPGAVYLLVTDALVATDSPASLHIEVTDAAGRVELWPSGPADRLVIHHA